MISESVRKRMEHISNGGGLKPTEIGLKDLMKFGQHKGMAISDVIELHPFYLNELIKAKKLCLDSRASGVFRMRLKLAEGTRTGGLPVKKLPTIASLFEGIDER